MHEPAKTTAIRHDSEKLAFLERIKLYLCVSCFFFLIWWTLVSFARAHIIIGNGDKPSISYTHCLSIERQGFAFLPHHLPSFSVFFFLLSARHSRRCGQGCGEHRLPPAHSRTTTTLFFALLFLHFNFIFVACLFSLHHSDICCAACLSHSLPALRRVCYVSWGFSLSHALM